MSNDIEHRAHFMSCDPCKDAGRSHVFHNGKFIGTTEHVNLNLNNKTMKRTEQEILADFDRKADLLKKEALAEIREVLLAESKEEEQKQPAGHAPGSIDYLADKLAKSEEKLAASLEDEISELCKKHNIPYDVVKPIVEHAIEQSGKITELLLMIAESFSEKKPQEIEARAGNWYKLSGDAIMFVEEQDGAKVKGYAFTPLGFGDFIGSAIPGSTAKQTIASPGEIQSAVYREAQRRGYFTGVKIESLKTGKPVTIDSRVPEWHLKNETTGQINYLIVGGCLIFDNGDWADIIEKSK